MIFRPYKRNILIEPENRQKIIGDTKKKYLYGKVLDVGSEVLDIHIGDTIAYTIFGVEEIEEADGTKHYIVQDSDDFVLGVHKNEN